MGKNLSELANRFKKAVEETDASRMREDADRRRAEERAAKRAELVKAARAELAKDVETFAKETGFLATSKKKNGAFVLSREAFSVTFAPASGDPSRVDLKYEGAAEGEHLAFDLDEDDEPTWNWSAGAETLPFFGPGLEEILVRGLGLPRPEEAEPEPEPGPAPVAAAPKKTVEEVLADRRKEQRAARRVKTTIRGTNSQPWEIRPSNPITRKAVEPSAAESSGAQPKGAWDVRPEHTDKERKKKERPDEGTAPGAGTKEYKRPLE